MRIMFLLFTVVIMFKYLAHSRPLLYGAVMSFFNYESESCSVVSNSLQPHVVYSPWNSLGQNTGMGSLSLFQEIFNPRIEPRSALQADSLSAEPQGSPRVLEWLAYPFSRGSSWPRNHTRVSCIAGGFFTNWAIREAFNYDIKSNPIPRCHLKGES